jgi:hypothetical protein
MAARAYRTRSFVNAEMSAGMVPVNALFVKLLIMHPHDAHAEKREHETKCVPVRTHLRQQAGTPHSWACAPMPNANAGLVSVLHFGPNDGRWVNDVQSHECSQRRDRRGNASDEGCLFKQPAARAPLGLQPSLQNTGMHVADTTTAGALIGGYIHVIFDRHAKLPMDAGSVPFSTGTIVPHWTFKGFPGT